MTGSPFLQDVLFQFGPVPVTRPVVVTWVIMALLVGLSMLATRRLTLVPSGRQAVLELVVSAIDSQIRDTMQAEPGPYRALIGTIFLYILVANWSSLVPGIEPPTATLETDAALALIVFAASIYHGVRTRGATGYLGTFAEPSWVMIPLNVVEQITRTFSMIVRLFGNVMSGAFIVGIVLSLAGLLVPIPLMALDLLTGTVQAYIFSILSMVFIGAAITGERPDASVSRDNERNENELD
jgi:F-type H+-transporting ATPase subunit a